MIAISRVHVSEMTYHFQFKFQTQSRVQNCTLCNRSVELGEAGLSIAERMHVAQQRQINK